SFRRTPSTHKIVPHTWGLIDGIQRETDKWRQARNAVYRDLYADPHLNVAMMLYRIVDLTYRAGRLESDFFLLNDADALVWLRERGQKELFAMLDSWRWYPEIYRAEIETPSARLITASRDPMLRGTLADLIAEHCNIAPHQVCIYAGEGRDDRVVDLPFLKDDGTVIQTREKKRKLWRITIYLDPDCAKITPNAINLIKTYLDIS
ncbi:MAG: hypothetical protein AAB372_04215, partial [Patescibacteria group bacterium]